MAWSYTGRGGDNRFDTMIHPPRVLALDWDPPALAMMGMASKVLAVPGVRPGAMVSVSHEGSAAREIPSASTLLWSARAVVQVRSQWW